MDKLKKIKHQHTLTDLLKFVIFSLIMLAPFFSIGGRMAYTIFNKNAKDSYSDLNYEKNTNFDFIPNEIYYFNINTTTVNVINANPNTINVKNFTLINTNDSTYNDWIITNNNIIAKINFFIYGNNLYIGLTNTNNQTVNSILTNRVLEFSFTFLNGQINDTYIKSLFFNYEYTGNTLDNAFDYSISKIADEPVFNWVKNTAIYDGINAMFTGLEYDTDNNPIAIMCAYWLLNTAVYIVIDIVVWAFTKMTHMFIQE